MADTTTPVTSPAPVEPKLAITSTTIWGIIVSILPEVLKVWHINLAPGWDTAAADLTSACVTFFGACVALWGRLKADRKLVLTK